MPERLSSVLGVDREKFASSGAFDGFFNFDSQFHIDPALLSVCSIPEFAGSHSRLEDYYSQILRLLDAAQSTSSVLWTNAMNRLVFREIGVAALGYTAEGANGRAIGPKLASELATTAYEIVKAGVKDPVIFELAGVIQPGIGADLVSDMTLSIILPDVIAYNDRLRRELGMAEIVVTINDSAYLVPCHATTDEPILLIPREILSPLPIAYSWEDIDDVCSYNKQLRARVNSTIGKTWKQATTQGRVTKRLLRGTLLQFPELIKDLVAQYKKKAVIPYDFDDDPSGELVWHDVAAEFAKLHPLHLSKTDGSDQHKVRETVRAICRHYRTLIEDNGLCQLLYDKKKVLKPERAAQLLFFGIADAYCKANNLDLSPECNSGRGPVDFKISKGYSARFSVEVKYTCNPKLVAGYEKQLPTYNAAERAFSSLYLVLQTGYAGPKIRLLNAARDRILSETGSAPEIVMVDAQIMPSASKL